MSEPTKRGVLGRKSKLAFAPRTGYVRRLINDDPRNPGRVEMLKEEGWEPVRMEDADISTARKASKEQYGATVTRSVGSGITGVLMEIPEDEWVARQAAKRQSSEELMSEIRANAESRGLTSTISFN